MIAHRPVISHLCNKMIIEEVTFYCTPVMHSGQAHFRRPVRLFQKWAGHEEQLWLLPPCTQPGHFSGVRNTQRLLTLWYLLTHPCPLQHPPVLSFGERKTPQVNILKAAERRQNIPRLVLFQVTTAVLVTLDHPKPTHNFKWSHSQTQGNRLTRAA